MSNPIILYENMFGDGVITVTDIDADVQYHKDYIGDLKNYTLWKAASTGTKTLELDLNKILDPSFELDDGSWTEDNGAINTNDVDTGSGSNSAENIVAGASSEWGVISSIILVDETKQYKMSINTKVSARSAGTWTVRLRFFADEAATVSIGSENIVELSTTTSWAHANKTVGPVGDSMNFDFPLGTKAIKIADYWAAGTGTAYLDDVFFWRMYSPDTIGFINHDFGVSGLIDLHYSDDVNGNSISSGTYVSIFSNYDPATNKAHLKTFTASANHRGYRVNVGGGSGGIHFVGAILLGQRLTFPGLPKSPIMFKDEQAQLNLARTRKGVRLKVDHNYTDLVLKGTIPFISEAIFASDFELFWNDHGQKGLPFLFAWDLTNEPAETYWAWFKGDYKFQKSMSVGGFVDEFKFDISAIKE